MKTRKESRTRVALHITAGATLAALAFFASRAPKSETIRQNPMDVAKTHVPEVPKCAPAPVSGDGKCEILKGEADPASKSFSASDCGYCMDMIVQIRADKGSKPFKDKDGRTIQYVTERESETPVSCPVDFIQCNDREAVVNKPYAGYILVRSSSGSNYSFGTINVNECDPKNERYCADDCTDINGNGNAKKEEPEGEPEPVRHCPVASISPLDSATAGNIQSQVRSKVRAKSAEIRNIVGVVKNITIRLNVTAEGELSMGPVSVKCIGDCRDGKNIAVMIGNLSIDGRKIAAPGKVCYWDIVTVF